MRKLIRAVFSLILIFQVNIVTADLNFGGYYKNFFTTLDPSQANEPLIGVVVNRVRANLSYVPTDVISFSLAYDVSPRVQDKSLFSNSPFGVSISSSRYRISESDSLIYPADDDSIGNIGIYHNLDRASINYSSKYADISIGRDAIAWGSARTINPTDVVAPFSFDQLDTEDRVGVDAIRIRIQLEY